MPLRFLVIFVASSTLFLAGCSPSLRIPEATPVANVPAASAPLKKRCVCPPVKRVRVAAKRTSVVRRPQVTRVNKIKPAVIRKASAQSSGKAFLASYSAEQRGAFGPPLSYAVSSKNLALTKQLLDNGANIEALDPMGYTPLGLAITEKSPHIVDLLLQRGANKSTDVPPYGKPLVAAIQVNSPEVVKVLLKHGVDKNNAKFQWRRPLDIAREKGNPAIISLLKNAGASSADDDFERENAERKMLERMNPL